MAKTNLHIVRNSRDVAIEYQNLENSGCNRSIPAGDTRIIGCDVPWVFNEEDFRKKRVEIQTVDGQVLAQIWQRDAGGADLVRVSNTGWNDPGDPIPGSSATGGKKLLVVNNDGVVLENLE